MSIENKIYYSKELDQHYRHTAAGVLFEDKIFYSNEEIELIAKSNIDIKTIHKTKFYFCGTVISPEQLEQLTETYEKEGSPIDRAIKLASELMKAGMKGWQATHRAGEECGVSPKAIGAELGKRRKRK